MFLQVPMEDLIHAWFGKNSSTSIDDIISMFEGVNSSTVNIDDEQSLTTTIVIDKSVPQKEFPNISVITEENGKTYSPKKHGEYDKVDGLFLKTMPGNKSWYKISDSAKATIYYDKKKGLYLSDTTNWANPARAIFWKYYVDWVNNNNNNNNDVKRTPPATNPYK